MKKITVVAFIFILSKGSLFAQFTQGNVVAYQVGDGSVSLTGTAAPAFLKEYTISGAPGFSVAIPTAGAARLTNSGSASSEGLITRSSNGQYIVIAGYDAAPGTAFIKSTSSINTARVIDTISFNGNTGRAVSSNSFYSADNFRSAASDGNANFWGSGPSSGVTYMGSGIAAPLITPVPNTRHIHIFYEQVYYSTGSGTTGIYQVGVGTPTTGGQASTLILATTSSPYGFAFNVTGDTCYVADDDAGITKYAFDGTAWSAVYLLTGTKTVGLVVDFNVFPRLIYATTTGSSANRIIKIADVGASSPITTIATAPINTAFRGLAFSPYCAAVTLAPLAKDSVCMGFPLTLQANSFGSNPIGYSWVGAGSFNSANISNPTIIGASTGVYTVSAINSCGTATATVNVKVNKLPDVTVNATNTVVCLGDQTTLTGTGANTYTWTNGITNDLAFTPTTTTTYTVMGTDTNGCVNTQTISIVVTTCSASDMEKYEVNKVDAVLFPNPNAGSFTIRTSLPANLFLYDVTGKLLIKQSIRQEEEIIKCQLENGIYLLQLFTHEGSYTNRIIITK